MNFSIIIGISFAISIAQFLLLWLPFYLDLSYYTDYGNDLICISNNHTFNWFFTYFFPAHATIYENLCERINNNGLAILLLLLSLITLPTIILMSLIGAIVLTIRLLWQRFCKTFSRQDEKNIDISDTSK